MKITLAIIGLGQIGASIGLALGAKTDLLQRVGYDVDPRVERQARKLNAIDKTARNLKNTVKEADVVLVAVPTDQVHEMLTEVIPLMKEGAVLMDTALGKEVIANWATELLPEGCCYVGLTPVINPQYLANTPTGIQGARVDLFQNGMIAISSPPNTNSKAIKLAADLARLLDASVLFADLLEVDSMMTATHVVPQLMAAALLNATVDQPNWREAGQMAGRAYAEVSGPIRYLGMPGTLAANAIQNQEHTLRVLNSVIAALENLRNDIEADDSASLTSRLERASQGRDQWWQARFPDELRPGYKPAKKSPASSLFGSLLRTGGRRMENEEQN